MIFRYFVGEIRGKSMKTIAKNEIKIIVPRISLAYERSQILSRVQDDLNVERVRTQQKRNKARERLVRHVCQECLTTNGLKLMMPNWMIQQHSLNHRIMRALGQEKEWIRGIQKREKERIEKFKKAGAIWREDGKIRRSNKRKIYDEWIWQRTILKQKKGQRERIAWITLKMGGPLWVVPVSVWSESTKIVPYTELTRALELCQIFMERMEEYHVEKSNVEKRVIVVSGWLSPSDKKYITKACCVNKVIEKEVILGQVISFIQWDKRG